MNIDWYEEIIQKAYDSKERRVNDGVYDISEIDFIPCEDRSYPPYRRNKDKTYTHKTKGDTISQEEYMELSKKIRRNTLF